MARCQLVYSLFHRAFSDAPESVEEKQLGVIGGEAYVVDCLFWSIQPTPDSDGSSKSTHEVDKVHLGGQRVVNIPE